MPLDQKFPYHSIPAKEALKKLESAEKGLTADEAKKRQQEYGPNELTGKEGVNPVLLFLKQFKDFLILVLVLAAGVAWYAGQMVDVYVIFGVILFNAIIGFMQEYRAEKSIEALKKMIKHETTVLRDGKPQTVQASELVPGDVVQLEEGDSVPADARIVRVKNLQTIEASLTGESLPIEKQTEALEEKTNLGDRFNMIWKGTHVARGSATAVVTAIGANTEIGKISESLGEIKISQTNFRRKTAKLGKQMAVIAIVTSIIVFLIGYFWREFDFEETLLVTVATLVSSIPEGLPAVISIVLAIGASRMAKQNAIIREFTATEMLGSVTVILSDKTGTITQSILTVNEVFLGSGRQVEVSGSGYEVAGDFKEEEQKVNLQEDPVMLQLLRIARYCNNARLDGEKNTTAAESKPEKETEAEETEAKSPVAKEPDQNASEANAEATKEPESKASDAKTSSGKKEDKGAESAAKTDAETKPEAESAAEQNEAKEAPASADATAKPAPPTSTETSKTAIAQADAATPAKKIDVEVEAEGDKVQVHVTIRPSEETPEVTVSTDKDQKKPEQNTAAAPSGQQVEQETPSEEKQEEPKPQAQQEPKKKPPLEEEEEEEELEEEELGYKDDDEEDESSEAGKPKDSEKHDETKVAGDPTEVALLVLAKKAEALEKGLLGEVKIIDDLPFNSEQKFRATLAEREGQRELMVVGAPERVLELCTQVLKPEGPQPLDEDFRNQIAEKMDEWAEHAMRVLALAYKPAADAVTEAKTDEVQELVWVGITGIVDPPREGVQEAIEQCRSAGIRVIMVTGDHKKTGAAIAREAGIISEEDEKETNEHPLAMQEDELDVSEEEFDKLVQHVKVFARVSPNMKLRIAEHLQDKGHLIAMTGDGVNDAPALKRADVGIAMGIRGTDVAKDASQIVLSDDNFATIVRAVREGRIVFQNVRQTSYFLLTTNFAMVATIITAIAIGWPYPLTATQILWVNLVTDGVMELGLATERGHGDIMKQKPVPRDVNILSWDVVPYLLIVAVFMLGLALGVFNYYLPQGNETARAAVFLIISMTQVFNTFNMRSLQLSVFSIGLFSNKWVNWAFLASLVLQLLAIKLPFMQSLFRFGNLAWMDVAILIALSSVVLWAGELYKLIRFGRSRNSNEKPLATAG